MITSVIHYLSVSKSEYFNAIRECNGQQNCWGQVCTTMHFLHVVDQQFRENEGHCTWLYGPSICSYNSTGNQVLSIRGRTRKFVFWWGGGGGPPLPLPSSAHVINLPLLTLTTNGVQQNFYTVPSVLCVEVAMIPNSLNGCHNTIFINVILLVFKYY